MTDNLLLYLIAVLTVNIFPGVDMVYIINQSISHGKRYGLAAALGIGAGCFVHIFAVTVGLSSIIFESAQVFTIVKYLGAAYLIYIGISSVLKKHVVLLNQATATNSPSWRKSFIQGFLTNTFNPKVALFFLAFLPQFVMPSVSHPIWAQMLFLGFVFVISGTVVNVMVALFFGAIKQWLSTHPTVLRIQQKLTGLILVGLGIRLAAFERA